MRFVVFIVAALAITGCATTVRYPAQFEADAKECDEWALAQAQPHNTRPDLPGLSGPAGEIVVRAARACMMAKRYAVRLPVGRPDLIENEVFHPSERDRGVIMDHIKQCWDTAEAKEPVTGGDIAKTVGVALFLPLGAAGAMVDHMNSERGLRRDPHFRDCMMSHGYSGRSKRGDWGTSPVPELIRPLPSK